VRVPPTRSHFTRFDRAQELGLGIQCEVADLVQNACRRRRAESVSFFVATAPVNAPFS
jgi:hypothetical protein